MASVEGLLKRDRAILVGAVVLLFVLAGLYTVFGVGMDMSAFDMTAMRGMRDMPASRTPGAWPLSYAVLVFLMWWVMMIAMMLPSVAPTILLFAALVRHTKAASRAPLVAAVFLGGYLLAWAGFSALAAFAQWLLEALGEVSATMMTLTGGFPGAMVLIAAGVFQFTPLKAACLQHCRSPAQFLVERKRPGVAGALAMGLEHGVYCLGCCWVLMALLFVGGIMNIYWIVGIAAFIAVEKLVPFGDRASKVAGAALVAWGIYVAVRLV